MLGVGVLLLLLLLRVVWVAERVCWGVLLGADVAARQFFTVIMVLIFISVCGFGVV